MAVKKRERLENILQAILDPFLVASRFLISYEQMNKAFKYYLPTCQAGDKTRSMDIRKQI